MNDKEQLESIRKKFESAQAFTLEDGEFLLKIIAGLEKKTALLSQHVLELTEEMENVKMDFGGGSR